MTATINWQDEAERLRTYLSAANARAEHYMAERNAARLEAQREAGEAMRKLQAERDAALAELAQAREVLMKAEWQPRQSWAETIYICPSCWTDRRDGHVPDCKLSAALAAKGE